MHLTLDILEKAKKISKEFQKDSCTLSTASDRFAAFLLQMKTMMTHNGQCLQSFLDTVERNGEILTWNEVTQIHRDQDDAQFEVKRENVLESIITYAKQRFGFLESKPILKAAQVHDPVNWPDFDVQPADYGVEEIDVLSKHFNSFLNHYYF